MTKRISYYELCKNQSMVLCNNIAKRLYETLNFVNYLTDNESDTAPEDLEIYQ